MPGPTLAFDITEIPFSVRGSWLNLSPVVGLHRRADDIHLVSHQTGMHAVLALRPVLSGQPATSSISAGPAQLRWTHPAGSIDATFSGPDTVRLRGTGLGLTIADAADGLTAFSGTYLLVDPRSLAAVFTSYETGRRYRLTVLRGHSQVRNAEALGTIERSVTIGGDGSAWEAVIEESAGERAPYRTDTDFDADVETNASDFRAYVDALAPWRNASTPAAELAAYVMWSATVRAAGFLGRESVLMSKHWMDKVWSWDHCFNALALAAGEPEAAWDQFLVPFDHQDDQGALPDSVTHSEVLYNFVKPPIHGWALNEFRSRLAEPLDHERLRAAYDRVRRWTEFWLDARRMPGHVLPFYQHGNDSGWDNSTTFDQDRVIESPDLAAFLIMQLDVLAGLADELDTGEQDGWRTKAAALQDALLSELWVDGRFVARGALSGVASGSTSLLNLLPLVLADRLPVDVRASLTTRLHEHLTEHGLATELPSSPAYEADGYWRGPIWAPATLLIENGLRRAGEVDLADTISARFRRLCERSGFAENFDAITGGGLRDRAYTWTASVYLLLARQSVP